MGALAQPPKSSKIDATFCPKCMKALNEAKVNGISAILCEAKDVEGFLGADRFAKVTKARADLRVVVAACIGVQAYLRPNEPEARKSVIASYKAGVASWIDADKIKLDEGLVKFLEAYEPPASKPPA